MIEIFEFLLTILVIMTLLGLNVLCGLGSFYFIIHFKEIIKDLKERRCWYKMKKYTTNATDEELLNYGFTNHHKPTLYFCKRVWFEKHSYMDFEITLNVNIDRKTRNVSIEILDEAFCQPVNPLNLKNKEIVKKIDTIIEDMVEKGIINE